MRLLLVEDSEDDAGLLGRHLAREGVAVVLERVEREDEMRAALLRGTPDAVISDFALPSFSGLRAIDVAREHDPDLPVLIVSGTVGEEIATEVMRAGARDFFLKDRLTRLAMALSREVAEASARRERRRAEAEQRRIEDARTREAELLLRVQQLSRSGGWQWRALPEGATDLFLTEGALAVFELPPGSPTPEALLRTLFSPAEMARLDTAVRSARPLFDLELQARTRLGREVWLRVAGRVELEVDGTTALCVGAVHDVTERRRLEGQLLLNDRLVAMGTIAAGVAHEINNPLTHLVASLPHVREAVRLKGGESLAEHVQSLDECTEAAARITAVVRDLRVFSRPDEASGVGSDLRKVVDSVLSLLAVETRHVVAVEVHVAPRLGVAAPPARLAQVLTNLVLNAVQAMAGRPAQDNRVRIEASSDGEVVEVTVADNGPGMSPAVCAQIFTPFYTTKPIGAGTGLGLAVVHQIVTQLQGTVTVQTAPGEGARFQVRLPASQDVAPSPLRPAPRAPSSRRLRILVVDDEPSLRRLMGRILKPHAVVLASSGAEALSLLASDAAFDVLLCDLMMPGLSGVELFHAVRQDHPGLEERILFASGGAVTPESRAFVRGFPPERLLTKPFTSQQLGAAVMAASARAR